MTSSPLPPLGPALELLQRLWALDHSLEALSGQMSERLGVTAPQRFIVRILGRYPGLSAGVLASLLHVDPGTVSAALARLESKGLIDRRRDPRDHRRAALGLTARGRELDHSTPGTVESVVEEILAETPAAELEAAVSFLARLTTRLSAERAKLAAPPKPRRVRRSPRRRK